MRSWYRWYDYKKSRMKRRQLRHPLLRCPCMSRHLKQTLNVCAFRCHIKKEKAPSKDVSILDTPKPHGEPSQPEGSHPIFYIDGWDWKACHLDFVKIVDEATLYYDRAGHGQADFGGSNSFMSQGPPTVDLKRANVKLLRTCSQRRPQDMSRTLWKVHSSPLRLMTGCRTATFLVG
ncbi:hypothetical protein KC337_g73 [Hortaea werneckii]|nr:hypothetical protein KC337_g73 [Hortaea werneckii]